MRRLLYKTTLALSLLPLAMYGQTEVSQEPVTLSLEDAMKYAVKHNVNAKNARLDVLLQKAKNAEITGLAYPQIKGDAKYMQYTDPVQSFVPGQFGGGAPGTFIPVVFTPTYNTSANLSGSQILFDGSVLVALQARNTIMKLMDQSAQLTEQDVKYNVQKSYYGLVVANKQFTILKSSLAFARNIGDEMKAMKEAGFIEKLDLDRTNVQINNLATDSVRIAGLLELSEQVLKFRMGLDIAQPIILSDTSLESSLLSANGLLLEDYDYNERVEYGLLQTQLSLNKYDLKRHRLSALPSLALFGNAGYNYSSNTFSDLYKVRYIFTSFWGLQLNVPLVDGWQRRSRVTQAKLNIQKTNNNIDNLKLGIDFQTSQAKTSLRNSLLSMESQKRNLDLANDVLDLSNKKYKAGVGSTIEVTQAQTQLLQAQNNYFQSMLDVINAQADLKKAAGQFK